MDGGRDAALAPGQRRAALKRSPPAPAYRQALAGALASAMDLEEHTPDTLCASFVTGSGLDCGGEERMSTRS